LVIPFNPIYLRLDVDRAVADININKPLAHLLNLYKLQTGLPAPFFLEHVYLTKEFLKKYNIRRIWFFRPFTCPDEFDEPHGLHSYSPKFFPKELEIVESKLGTVKYFTRHGARGISLMQKRIYSHHLFHNLLRISGRPWKKDEIKRIEKEYDVIDVTDRKHRAISGLTSNYNLSDIEQILFHPCYIKTHKHVLKKVLDELKCSK